MTQPLPSAAAVRGFIESLDRRLLALFEAGEPDDATLQTIANLELARNAALRVLDETEDR